MILRKDLLNFMLDFMDNGFCCAAESKNDGTYAFSFMKLDKGMKMFILSYCPNNRTVKTDDKMFSSIDELANYCKIESKKIYDN